MKAILFDLNALSALACFAGVVLLLLIVTGAQARRISRLERERDAVQQDLVALRNEAARLPTMEELVREAERFCHEATRHIR